MPKAGKFIASCSCSRSTCFHSCYCILAICIVFFFVFFSASASRHRVGVWFLFFSMRSRKYPLATANRKELLFDTNVFALFYFLLTCFLVLVHQFFVQ
jgi:hypothetical protein